jgi:hypothetical protein
MAYHEGKSITINIEGIENVDWRDITVERKGTTDFTVKIKGYPGVEKYINLSPLMMSFIRGHQMHIGLHEDLRNKGLGYKIYKAAINHLGFLFSSKGRRMGENVTAIWVKLEKDTDVEVYNISNFIHLGFSKSFPENKKEELIGRVQQMMLEILNKE